VTAEQSEKWLAKVHALERQDRAVHRLIEVVQKQCHGTPDENVERFLDALVPVVEAHGAVRGTSG